MRTYCFFLLLFTCFRTAAQPTPFGQYPLDFISYQQDKGLSQNSVHALTTTASGFTWIGTEDGLNRFDGYRFQVFRRKPGQANSLSWNHISALAMDDQPERLWAGTIRRGVSVYHTRLDSFTRIPLSITGPASNEWVNHISFIGNHAWIAADSGVVVISRSDFSVKHTVRTGGVVKRVLPGYNAVLFYFENGDVWTVNEGGGVISRKAAAAFWGETLQVQDVEARQNIHSISTTRGFFVWEAGHPGARPQRQPVATAKEDFSTASFSAYLRDSRGREWLALSGEGLLVKNSGETVFRHYTYNPAQPLSLSDNTITAMVEDASENIWIGTQKGLIRLAKYPGWLYSFTNNGTEESALFNRLQTVFTPDNNTLYIGGKSGLFILNRQSGEVQSARTDTAVHYERFYFIRPFAPQQLLVSSYAGVQVLEQRGGTYVLDYATYYPELDSLKNRRISTVASISADEYLFGGIHAGCWYWNKATHQLYSISNQPAQYNTNYNVYHLQKVADSFFVATNRGLFTWRKGASFVRPFRIAHPAFAGQPHINSLTVTGNKLWMAFTSEGVGCLDLKNGALKIYNTDNGLRNNISYSLLADLQGRIWVSGVAGLAVIFPKEERILYYTHQDGLQGNEATNFCFWQQGGHLYFGGPNGLSIIDAKAYQPSTAVPTAVFSRLEVLQGNKFQEWGTRGNLSFAPHQNSLNVYLSVTDAGLQHRIEYLYRLLPVEKAWISNGTANNLSFTNLPPGNYTLEVKAVTEETEQAAKPTVLHFTVRPAWWQTAWFKAAVVLLLAGTLFYTVRLYYLARLRRQRLEYEKLLAVQAERQRISAEIHDDLGAGLSGIRLLTELTRKKAGNSELHTEVDKIYASVSELTGKMREVIWSLNRENDTLENLLYYLQRQAYKLFEPSGINVSVLLPGDIPEVIMSGEKRRHIYLAVNEALHNCLRHSGADSVKLKMKISATYVVFTVSDNGKGIQINGAEGNGLRNMQRRMKEVDGIFLVQQQNGTVVQFLVPIK